LGTIELFPCNPMLCACISGSSYFHSFNVYVPNLNIAENGIRWSYTMHVHSIFIGYTMEPPCVVLTEKFSSLKLSGFIIRLP
jgi:hypothetical protein